MRVFRSHTTSGNVCICLTNLVLQRAQIDSQGIWTLYVTKIRNTLRDMQAWHVIVSKVFMQIVPTKLYLILSCYGRRNSPKGANYKSIEMRKETVIRSGHIGLAILFAQFVWKWFLSAVILWANYGRNKKLT